MGVRFHADATHMEWLMRVRRRRWARMTATISRERLEAYEYRIATRRVRFGFSDSPPQSGRSLRAEIRDAWLPMKTYIVEIVEV